MSVESSKYEEPVALRAEGGSGQGHQTQHKGEERQERPEGDQHPQGERQVVTEKLDQERVEQYLARDDTKTSIVGFFMKILRSKTFSIKGELVNSHGISQAEYNQT